MIKMLILVDLENVKTIDLKRIPGSAHIKIFVGVQQKSLPADLVEQAQALGSRLAWVRVDGNGSNALDFHIACHLGEGLARSPETEFVILSRDKGFDPLIRHLARRGVRCRRIEAAAEIAVAAKPAAAAAPAPSDPSQQVLKLLKGIEKNKRPRKRQTLTNYVATHFNKKLLPEQVQLAIEQLVKEKLIAGTDSAVTYNF